MPRLFRIFALLIVVISIGYFIGTRQEKSVTNIYGPNGELLSQQISTGVSLNPVANLDPEQIPWYVSRSSAIAAYLMLFILVFWGLGMTIGFVYSIIDPARAWQLHKDMGISFGVLVVVHAFSLLFDRYLNFSVFDILVPYSSSFKPLYLSLGIVSFYLLLMVIITSIFLRLKLPRLWRSSHYLTFVIFVLALIHGLNVGSDSKTTLMQIIYITTAFIIGSLAIYRFGFSRRARLLK